MNVTAERIGTLIDRGAEAATSFLRSLETSPIRPRLGSCCCEIPPPCWLPRDLGEVRSHVCAGGTASLRLRVENCSPTARQITIEATSADVKISPAKLSLGPMERGVAVASLATDPKAGTGTEREVLIWVRGCYDHVVRWTVRVGGRASDACHELDVEDCPDFVHHWYDHFYCDRPCLNRG